MEFIEILMDGVIYVLSVDTSQGTNANRVTSLC